MTRRHTALLDLALCAIWLTLALRHRRQPRAILYAWAAGERYMHLALTLETDLRR